MTRGRDRNEARRLLRHLALTGCYAVASPLGCGRVALYRDVVGTSLGAGYVGAETVTRLTAEGLVTWIGTGKAARLALCEPTASTPAEPQEAAAESPGRMQPAMDDRESPLLWLYRRPDRDGRPQISEEEFAAGERFRADITLARMLPRTTMNWDAAQTPEGHSPWSRDIGSASDSSLAARQRVRAACDKLGPELSGLAIDVCGFLKGLEFVERERRWPPRSAKVVLRVALAALATHYGLDRRRGPARPRGWRAEDARPVLFPAAAE